MTIHLRQQQNFALELCVLMVPVEVLAKPLQFQPAEMNL
jgi:hypothetical protein